METHPKLRVRPGPAYRRLVVPAFAFSVVFGVTPIGAAEYCVTCSAPAAMYACVVQGSLPDAPPDPREQLICIAELANSGGHDTCSVPRSAPKPCPGVLKIVAPSSAVPPPAPPQAEADSWPADVMPSDNAGGVGAANPNVPPPAKPNAPRTVEELANETVKTSKQGLEKAGNAVTGTAKKAGEQVGKAGSSVGKAAKKTWDCVVSLFNDC